MIELHHLSLGSIALIVGVIWKVWSMSKEKQKDIADITAWRTEKDLQIKALEEAQSRHESADQDFMKRIEERLTSVESTMSSMARDLNQLLGYYRREKEE